MPTSFIVYTFQAGAVPPHHAYVYDEAGAPLTEQQANDLAVRLQFWPSDSEAGGDLHLVVLPAEPEPDLPKPGRLVD